MSGSGILSLPIDLKEGNKEAKEGKYSVVFLVQLTFSFWNPTSSSSYEKTGQKQTKKKVLGLGELWPYQIYQLVLMTLTWAAQSEIGLSSWQQVWQEWGEGRQQGSAQEQTHQAPENQNDGSLEHSVPRQLRTFLMGLSAWYFSPQMWDSKRLLSNPTFCGVKSNICHCVWN